MCEAYKHGPFIVTCKAAICAGIVAHCGVASQGLGPLAPCRHTLHD